jgi:hypothetical protein
VQKINCWLWFTIVIVFVGWVLQIKSNAECKFRASNTRFINEFQKFVSHHPNKFKHIENLVLKKLNEFRHYPINANCKCALSWWWIKSHKFPITTKFKKHIWRILLSQIKTNFFFSIVGIFTSTYKHHPQTKSFEILIFVNKNSPLNPDIGYYKHFSLSHSFFSLHRIINDVAFTMQVIINPFFSHIMSNL